MLVDSAAPDLSHGGRKLFSGTGEWGFVCEACDRIIAPDVFPSSCGSWPERPRAGHRRNAGACGAQSRRASTRREGFGGCDRTVPVA